MRPIPAWFPVPRGGGKRAPSVYCMSMRVIFQNPCERFTLVGVVGNDQSIDISILGSIKAMDMRQAKDKL